MHWSLQPTSLFCILISWGLDKERVYCPWLSWHIFGSLQTKYFHRLLCSECEQKGCEGNKILNLHSCYMLVLTALWSWKNVQKKVLQIFFKLMKFSWWLHGALHKWGDCSYYQWTNTDILSWKHWVIFLQIFFPMIRNIKQELIDQRDLFFLNSAQPDLNIHTTKDWRLDIGQLTLSMDAFEQK